MDDGPEPPPPQLLSDGVCAALLRCPPENPVPEAVDAADMLQPPLAVFWAAAVGAAGLMAAAAATKRRWTREEVGRSKNWWFCDTVRIGGEYKIPATKMITRDRARTHTHTHSRGKGRFNK